VLYLRAVNARWLLLPLSLAVLTGCEDDKKQRLEAMGTPPPSAPPPWARASASAPAPASSKESAAEPVKLTGNKKLRERLLGGRWVRKVSEAKEAESKAELAKAEEALKSAKTEAEKRAAKVRKATVEEVAFAWTEFSDKKRATKAPPNRLVLERPYEVIKEEENRLTLRVWDEINPQGGLEIYTFLGDDLVRLVQGDSERFDLLERRK
jgi:hypothetical protein